MSIYRAKLENRISKPVLILAFPIIIIGLLIDFLVNLIVCTIFFQELPQEWLVTPRLARHKNTDTSTKGKIAKWVCVNMLDIFTRDGPHCK